MWCVWSRIPFSSVLLKISSTIISKYPGTVCVSLFLVVINIVWFLIWGSSVAAYLFYETSQDSDTIPAGILFLFFVSLFWGEVCLWFVWIYIKIYAWIILILIYMVYVNIGSLEKQVCGKFILCEIFSIEASIDLVLIQLLVVLQVCVLIFNLIVILMVIYWKTV